MQEKAKKLLENIEVEDFLIDEINQNRKNTFSEDQHNKNTNRKGDQNNKSEYKKFFIEFPKINPMNTNLKFNNISNIFKNKNNNNTSLNESYLDKSKLSSGIYLNEKIQKRK
jgi:hypothetical protein